VSDQPTQTQPGVSRRDFLRAGAATLVGGIALTQGAQTLAQQFAGPGGVDVEAAKLAGYTVKTVPIPATATTILGHSFVMEETI
jgi:hypothetical protein